MPALKTKRLGLLPSEPAPADPDWARMLLYPQPYASAYSIEENSRLYESLRHPPEDVREKTWEIYLRAGDANIGRLYTTTNYSCTVLRYEIDAMYQNQGYATEAVEAVADWLLSRQDARFVSAVPAPYNPASVRVLEKSGFSRLGIGTEGPLWVRERPYMNRIHIGFCLGLITGCAAFMLSRNAPLSFSLLPFLIFLIGFLLEARERSCRCRLKELLLSEKKMKLFTPSASR